MIWLKLNLISKFFIPIKGPEGHTDNTATYTCTFIIKTHSIEQFNQNEITLQDCGIIIIIIYIYIYTYTYIHIYIHIHIHTYNYIFFFIIIIIPALIFISHARVLLDNFYHIFMSKYHITTCV